MGTLAAIALCAVINAGQPNTGGKESVRVYVFATTTAGETTPDQGSIVTPAAVHEMREAIRRKAGLRVVDDRTQADVTVEITGFEQQEGEGGFGGIKLTPLVTTTIRLHVTSGHHATDLKGSAPGTGSGAAKEAADRLLKWIVRNRLDRSPGPQATA